MLRINTEDFSGGVNLLPVPTLQPEAGLRE